MSKAVMITIFILFALGFSGAYYLGKNSQQLAEVNTHSPKSSTVVSNWKAYRNLNHGFSIQYPSQWSITDKKTLFTSALDAQWLNSSGDRCAGECVEFVLYDNFNLEKAKSNFADGGMASSASATVEKKDGKEITKVVKTFSRLVDDTGKWEEEKDKAYLIYIPVDDNYLQLRTNFNNKVTLDKIADTFSQAN